MCLICNKKIQGGLIAAPMWVGLTLIATNTPLTFHLWTALWTVAALSACIGLLVWDTCKYRQLPKGICHESDRHPQPELLGKHNLFAHVRSRRHH